MITFISLNRCLNQPTVDTLQCLAVLLVPHAVENQRLQKTKRINQRKRGVLKRRRSRLSDADVVVVVVAVVVVVVTDVVVVVVVVVVEDGMVMVDVVVMETGMET